MENESCLRGSVEARAKLNLTLQVLGRRSDGLHELSSVMTTLSLADRLLIELHKNSFKKDVQVCDTQKTGRPMWRVDADVGSIPSGEGNICYRAAELFFERLNVDPSSVRLSISIEKNIPDAAGLGGGSADAAAVLRFLFQNQDQIRDWFGSSASPLSLGELEQIALRCGADVPFCLYGGTRLCEGVGEIMTPLPPLFPFAVLLATPAQFVQTKTAFKMLDRFRNNECCDRQAHVSLRELTGERSWRGVIAQQSVQVLEPLIHNDFTPVIAGALERVGQLLDALRALEAPVVSMSGSGPTCFALFNDISDCENVLSAMTARFPDVRFFKTTINSTVAVL